MNIYLAACFSLKEKTRGLYQLIEEHDHTISKDWTSHKTTQPKENPDGAILAQAYATEDIEGVRNCDVFILLADGPPGTVCGGRK